MELCTPPASCNAMIILQHFRMGRARRSDCSDEKKTSPPCKLFPREDENPNFADEEDFKDSIEHLKEDEIKYSVKLNDTSFDEVIMRVHDDDNSSSDYGRGELEKIEKVEKLEKFEIDPEYLSSLPPGWSYKNIEAGHGSLIKHFICPGGREYQSRIEAVRSLSQQADRQEEAALLRAGLRADGWISHPLLPLGWFAKPVLKSGASTSLKFLSDKNEVFPSKRRAMRYLEDSQDNFAAENIEKFQGIYLNMRRTCNQEDWAQDDCLPEGWRHRTRTGDVARILSPSGEMFSSRYKALQYMVCNGFSVADVSKMRSSLVFDGWLEAADLLPPHWRYRKSKSGRNEHDFLSPHGEIFKSKKSLVDYFLKSPDYTEEDINKMAPLFEEMKSKWVTARHQWEVGDPSVPPGWKVRHLSVCKGGKTLSRLSLLSPAGLMFKSRLKAVQHLLQTKSESGEDIVDREDGEDIEDRALLDCLAHEGWHSSALLPHRWRVKTSREKAPVFFSPDGSVLSLKAAVSHMESCGEKYSREDLDNILRLSRDCREQLQREKIVWGSHPSVPAGWQYRSLQHNNSTREYFLTPHGVQMVGRVNTIQTLLERGRALAEPEVQTLLSGLPCAGWQDAASLLPPGWWTKEKEARPGSLKYLSPDCREFPSLTSVFHHLKANDCPSYILNNIKKKLNVINILSNRKVDKKERRTYKWQEADFLPTGWKFAEKELRYCGNKVWYLSDSGILLKSAALAFQLMKAENVEWKYLAAMEDRLREEGWQEDQYLPPCWKVNLDRKKFPEGFLSKDEDTDVLFLTNEGNLLTRNEASELISDKSRTNFSEEQESNFLFFLSSLARKIEDRDWKDDEDIPQGWKVKDLGLGSVTQVMSSSGQIFDSFLSAFISSTTRAMESDDIVKLKSKLSEEGFVKDERLPDGWLISRSRRGQLFEILSSEGRLFLTLDAAQEYMEASSSYSDQNILELEELCMEEVEIYIKSKSSKIAIKLEPKKSLEGPHSRGVKRKFAE